jgi:hypothetical protein
MIKFEAIIPPKGAIEKQSWEAIKGQLEELVKNRTGSIVCPEHHKKPTVTVVGPLKKAKFEVNGCCQQLIDTTLEALKGE